MIAVDTNVIVRLITGDDVDQERAALDLAAREDLFVSLTVLVETEWVLRSRYGYDRSRTHDAMLGLAALLPIHFEAAKDVDWALGRFARGGELADFVHIAAARGVGRFATFETRLAVRAGENAPAGVEILA